MVYVLPISVCLGVLLLLGLAERVSRDRARAAVPIRIHVNGTRGKSTVTRLIWSALREAGVPAVAKTTGAAPRVARRAGARAIVAECMAVRPDLQWTTERDMIGATVGVITNVRTDHTEVMGRTLPEIASSMANTIPRDGVLVTAEERFIPLFQRRAESCGARIVQAPMSFGDLRAPRGPSGQLAENWAVALTVTRELGIPDRVALAGMAGAPPDPGVARAGIMRVGSREVRWFDATSANDPESLALLLGEWGWEVDLAGLGAGHDHARLDRALVVYNHRADRPLRLGSFAALSQAFRRSALAVVTGDRPSLTLWRAARRGRGDRPLRFASRRRLPATIRDSLEANQKDPLAAVLFCGNTRGLGVEKALEKAGHRG
jgi:poly-gamma-glutamate synthase PgsB/CapB